jgi:hypothetical protein
VSARDDLSLRLHQVISRHLPVGAVIKADEIHEAVLGVVLFALRSQTPPAREYLFAMMACAPAERERALDAYRDEVAHELAEKIRAAEAPEGTPDGRFSSYINGWAGGRYAAADLIDPEVE